MANPQNPQGNYDPAGSTQMFRAFVDEGPQGRQQPAAAAPAGPRIGLIVGVVVARADVTPGAMVSTHTVQPMMCVPNLTMPERGRCVRGR
jgi:hypothetical protein